MHGDPSAGKMTFDRNAHLLFIGWVFLMHVDPGTGKRDLIEMHINLFLMVARF